MFTTAEQLARAAQDAGLLSDRQVQETWGKLGSRSASVEEFEQALLGAGHLTAFQVSRLKRGEKDGFFYGDYKVLYLVGSGAFARVYRSVHKTTGEIVALKVLRQRFTEGTDPDSEDALEQFKQEGEVGMTLRHSNIVPIYDLSMKGKHRFLVMEFVEGRNLREFIKIRKTCAPDEALRLISEVASGLDYAFERGIAHRDIKLSNVLVSGRGTAKLVDFGLAAPGRDITDDNVDYPNPRTIDYAALERATGVRRDDKRSDIFFVGCMLYHLLSGKAPLSETRERMKRLSKSRFRDIEPIQKVVSGLPRPVVTVVNKAMQFDPKLRYQSPKELLIDLDKAIAKLNEPSMVDQQYDDDTVIEDQASRKAKVKPQRAVMFVESNAQLQDVLRQRLKSGGFRVLVTSDPQRALDRFEDDFPPAHCVVFSTYELGEPALEAFEKFTKNANTEEIPAVLLLGEAHGEWANRVDDADHHVAVHMPIKLGKFREILDQLVPHASLSPDPE